MHHAVTPCTQHQIAATEHVKVSSEAELSVTNLPFSSRFAQGLQPRLMLQVEEEPTPRVNVGLS